MRKNDIKNTSNIMSYSLVNCVYLRLQTRKLRSEGLYNIGQRLVFERVYYKLTDFCEARLVGEYDLEIDLVHRLLSMKGFADLPVKLT